MLSYILKRLRAGLPGLPVMVATTRRPQDDTLADLCKAEGVPCFRGSELDVLDRYYRSAVEFGLSQVVRLTGDNPFVDLKELGRLVALHSSTDCDYSHSFNHLPLGTAAEVFSLPCLIKTHREGLAPHHREHVNEYVLENPGLFNIQVLEVEPGKRWPDLRLTVDTPEDYQRACRIVAEVDREVVQTEDAIAWLLQSA
jgi:spore coat polysaccharide biosynthesis protein SpsF